MYDDQSRYSGSRNVEKNLIEGKGQEYWANGEVYDGEYRDGTYNGEGTYYYKDESETTGEWKNGEQHGEHIFINKQGDAVMKIYENG